MASLPSTGATLHPVFGATLERAGRAMWGRAMIFGSVLPGRPSRGPCGPLGWRPLEAVDPRRRHPAGAVKWKVQAAPPARTIIASTSSSGSCRPSSASRRWRAAGSLPQNINFAIRSQAIDAFLASNGVEREAKPEEQGSRRKRSLHKPPRTSFRSRAEGTEANRASLWNVNPAGPTMRPRDSRPVPSLRSSSGGGDAARSCD